MRIYTRKCEFSRMRKLTDLNVSFRIWGYTLIIVNFHLWKCTRKCVIPLCGFSQSSVNSRMRRYTVPCEFPHEEKCITSCGCTREKVNFPRRGNSPNFDFPHMRIYTYNCVFPLVEMHPKMRISAVQIYTIFGVLPHAEIHSLMWIPSRGKVYFHGRGFA